MLVGVWGTSSGKFEKKNMKRHLLVHFNKQNTMNRVVRNKEEL